MAFAVGLVAGLAASDRDNARSHVGAILLVAVVSGVGAVMLVELFERVARPIRAGWTQRLSVAILAGFGGVVTFVVTSGERGIDAASHRGAILIAFVATAAAGVILVAAVERYHRPIGDFRVLNVIALTIGLLAPLIYRVVEVVAN